MNRRSAPAAQTYEGTWPWGQRNRTEGLNRSFCREQNGHPRPTSAARLAEPRYQKRSSDAQHQGRYPTSDVFSGGCAQSAFFPRSSTYSSVRMLTKPDWLSFECMRATRPRGNLGQIG